MAKKIPENRLTKSRAPIFIIGGFILIILGLMYHIHINNSLSFRGNFDVMTAHYSKAPKQLIIKQLEVALPIKQTVINKGAWEIYKEGASHLSTSGYPDEKKPIIVYAHNKTNQFGRINELKKGDEIILSDGLNHYLYQVSNQKIVDPSNINALKESRGETLILYTCVGFADSKRLLVYAKRVE